MALSSRVSDAFSTAAVAAADQAAADQAAGQRVRPARGQLPREPGHHQERGAAEGEVEEVRCEDGAVQSAATTVQASAWLIRISEYLNILNSA